MCTRKDFKHVPLRYYHAEIYWLQAQNYESRIEEANATVNRTKNY